MTEAAVEQREGKRVDLRTLTYKPVTNLDELRAAAQLAIQVEFTTIPAYLTALYSIADRTSDAYQALRSVAVEEMFHINQAANILVGVGGRPKFTGEVVPVYPTYLPSASKTMTPYVGLFQASQSVFQNVFMGIETPSAFDAPPQDANYQTIGQLYAALWLGIDACVAKEAMGGPAVFTTAEGARQRTDIYLGKFGGKPVDVRSRETAKAAIVQIVRQGEGAVTSNGSLVATEPFGAYQHYGQRTDGTYGPILGTPVEMSHYIKFQQVANAASFPPTYPIVSNPRLSDFSHPVAIATAKAFNKVYSLMLRSLEASFTTGPADDAYFRVTLPLMHEQLPNLAWTLMQTPVSVQGDAAVGPNAAPTWEWDERSSFADVLAALKDAAEATAQPAVNASSDTANLMAMVQQELEGVIAGLTGLEAVSKTARLGL